ncbi:TPA: SDR family oxidoreductase [Klebsiella variicola]|uniref:SDR family oxidoreductase n=1 Tax=Klebsiella TaxID=570 RepID=UPI00296811E1|nr:SDR family oxidoreductase [Klebsiella variicola subsp. variicola]HCT1821584.1 SDR family oxidoreductase [Klebsiella variicola]HDH1244559.1 SDR family oxidoreductase [Klebsiella variicola subsp. variicola]
MKILLTGATGFIGSYLLPELLRNGHEVIGLTRTGKGAKTLEAAGATAMFGELTDLKSLRDATNSVDGVIHTAFNHDFSKLKENSEIDRRVIETLGEALAGSQRPLVVSSGTGLVDRSRIHGLVRETDKPVSFALFPRAATEEAAASMLAKGVNIIVVRLSQVHDTEHQGRLAEHIRIAREKGFVAYVGQGENRLSAVHVTDAARLYRLALEKGETGAHYHAVAEEGVPMHAIAAQLAESLSLPVRSISTEEVEAYFGWIAALAHVDLGASGKATQAHLGWLPDGPGLL